MPVDSTCPLSTPARVEYGARARWRRARAGDGGGVDRARARRGAEIGGTWGMCDGGTLPSSAESSGGGVLFGTARGPSTRVLSTKGPSTTSSTERISQAVTRWPVDVEPAHRARVTAPRPCRSGSRGWRGGDRPRRRRAGGRVVRAAQDVAARHELTSVPTRSPSRRMTTWRTAADRSSLAPRWRGFHGSSGTHSSES